jgi:hypothetical protein
VRRLLQLGTCLLVLVALVTPICECFDRWDAPGLSNDAEFAVFCLILTLCLVLLVSRLIAALALLLGQFSVRHLQKPDGVAALDLSSALELIVPPRNATPLRI